MKVWIFNDTSYENHFGCILVVKTLTDIAKEVFKERSIVTVSITERKVFNPYSVQDGDVVLLNGEGSFHHDGKAAMYWIKVLSCVREIRAERVKIALVNSSWFCNVQLNQYLGVFDLISLRDKLSKEEVLRYRKNDVIYCPDLAYFGARKIMEEVSLPSADIPAWIFLQGGVDNPSPQISGGRHVSIFSKGCKFRNFLHQFNRSHLFNIKKFRSLIAEFLFSQQVKTPESYMGLINCSSAVISGRYHTIVMACALNKRILPITSNTPKIQSFLKDFNWVGRIVEKDGPWVGAEKEIGSEQYKDTREIYFDECKFEFINALKSLNE